MGSSSAPARTLTVIETHTGETVAQAGLAGEIPIGALLPLTGDLSSEGAPSRAIVEMAVEDLNSYVKHLGLPITFKLYVEDSGTRPAQALEKLQSLHAGGLGPSWGSRRPRG